MARTPARSRSKARDGRNAGTVKPSRRRAGDVALTVTMPRELHERAAARAAKDERTLVGLIRIAVRGYCDEMDRR